jgi:hypothetical protein
MAFEKFFDKPMEESLLLDQLIAELQTHYSKYQDECYFLRLSKGPEKSVQVSWAKAFKNSTELKDYYYDTKFERACVVLKFQDGKYEIMIQGFYLTDHRQVSLESSTKGRPIIGKGNIESMRMPPQELIEKGFADLQGHLIASSRKKAV